MFKHRVELQWIPSLIQQFPEAEVFVVGGTVRDRLRNQEPKDLDLVVSGVESKQLEAWLEDNGTVNFVGTHFGVWKFVPFHNPTGPEIDIALPRTEAPIGDTGAYKHFAVHSDPHLPIEKDLARRDFQMNAIAWSWNQNELIDPFDGEQDIKHKVIQCVGNPHERFAEDSTRMLRALRFAVQLGFHIENQTQQAIESLSHRIAKHEDGKPIIAHELIGSELQKGLRANPVMFLELLHTSKFWDHLFHTPFPEHILAELPMNTSYPLTLLTLAQTQGRTWREQEQWIRHWHLHPSVDLQALHAIHLVRTTEPSAHSLAEIEQRFVPFRELILTWLKQAGPSNREEWAKRILGVFKHSHDQEGAWIPPFITGKTLQKHGVPEGPLYKAIIDDARNAQLRGEVQTQKNAEAFLKETLARYDQHWN